MEYFPGFKSIEIFKQIQKDLRTRQINPGQFEYILDAREVSDYATKFQRGHWSFLDRGNEGKWYGTCVYKPDGKWDKQANQMIELIAQSGHPVFRGTSALNRGALKRKSGRNTIHFTADSGNTELFVLRTIHSANQPSIYGATSSWCMDLFLGRMEIQESTGVNMSSSEEKRSCRNN